MVFGLLQNVLHIISCHTPGPIAHSLDGRAQDMPEENINPDAQSQDCLDIFKLTFAQDCTQLSGSAKTACMRIPLSTIYYKQLAHKLNYCSAAMNKEMLKEDYINTALKVLNKSPEGENINELISDAQQKEIAIIADQVENNVLLKKPILDGMDLNDEKIQNLEENLTSFYTYTHLCLYREQPCTNLINIKQNYPSELFRQIKLICTQFASLKYEELIKEDYRLQKQILATIFKKLAIYYYKTGIIPDDMETFLRFNDFSCSDPNIINAVKAFELTQAEPNEMTESECSSQLMPIPNMGGRLQDPMFYISVYDEFSFFYLKDPQKYIYTNKDGEITLRSSGLDGKPNTDDDVIISTTVENLHALRAPANAE